MVFVVELDSDFRFAEELDSDFRFAVATAIFPFCEMPMDFLLSSATVPREFLEGAMRGDFRMFSFPILDGFTGSLTGAVLGVLVLDVAGDFIAEKFVFIFAVEVTLGTNGISALATGVLKSVALASLVYRNRKHTCGRVQNLMTTIQESQ